MSLERGWVGYAIVLALLLAAICFTAVSKAQAHSWYDPDCCSGQDCEPVSAVSFVASDLSALPVMIVTTSLGTKPLTEYTKVRQSKDGRMHACIFSGYLLCLYMPPSN